MWLAIVVIVLLVVLIIAGIAMYNGLIRSRNQIENAWSQIDVQLKRRLDLIPNLVETVKGYAAHERETLDAVIRARNAAIAAPPTPHDQANADNQLTGALRSHKPAEGGIEETPVRVFPIAYSKDAAAGVLGDIAEASGGQSFDASDSRRIGVEFERVVNNF